MTERELESRLEVLRLLRQSYEKTKVDLRGFSLAESMDAVFKDADIDKSLDLLISPDMIKIIEAKFRLSEIQLGVINSIFTDNYENKEQ